MDKNEYKTLRSVLSNDFYYLIRIFILMIYFLYLEEYYIYLRKENAFMSKFSKKEEQKIINKYEQISKEMKPKPKYFKNIILAFLVGGSICTIGQFILNMMIKFGVDKGLAKIWLPIIMIFLGALLTGIGVYDKIATFGGAGTVVPITGFSNAVVSPAIEFKKEGFVFGVAAKMFTIAGPVLVYGIGTSVIIGLVYYILGLFGIV